MKVSLLIILVLVIPLVYAQSISISPEVLELHKGETGKFNLQIENDENVDLGCDFSTQNNTPFVIDYNQNLGLNVKRHSIKNAVLEVSVPEDISFGEYKEKFCIECYDPSLQVINIDNCDLYLNIKILRENESKSQSTENTSIGSFEGISWGALGILVFILILIATGVFVRKGMVGKKEEEEKEESKKH